MIITAPETNEDMLGLIRADRPNQTIHEVISFIFNEEFGFYDVKVIMQIQFSLDGIHTTTIKKAGQKIPYPLAKYLELDENLQTKWRLSDYWSLDRMVEESTKIFKQNRETETEN